MSLTMTTNVKSRIENFFDELYLCGTKEISRTNFLAIKFCWFVILSIGFYGTTYYIWRGITEYNDEPVATKVQFNVDRYYDYPNLVVCPNKWIDYDGLLNFNLSLDALAYGLSHVPFLERDYYLVNDTEQNGKEEFNNFSKTPTLLGFVDFFKTVAKSTNRIVSVPAFAVRSTNLSVSKIFFQFQICYKLELASLDCSRQTMNYPPMILIHFAGPNEPDYLNVSRERTDYTLSINPDLKFSSKMSDRRLTLEPNYIYTLAMLPKKFVALNKDRKKCAEKAKNPAYSQPMCHSNCIQRFLKQKVGCVQLGLFDEPDNETQLCNPVTENRPPRNEPFKNDKAEEEFEKMGRECSGNCLPPCEHFSYEITFSKADKVVRDIHGRQMDAGNTSSVEIFYDVCNNGLIEFVEFERYTFENLISDIGGLLGLWIGASAITFVQMVMCFVEILMIKFYGKKHSDGDAVVKRSVGRRSMF